MMEDFVDSYIQKHIQQGSARGLSPEDMEKSMETASFILSIKMLRNYHSGEAPTGEEMVTSLAEVMQETPAQAREILASFQERGWLDAHLNMTAAGRILVGDAE